MEKKYTFETGLSHVSKEINVKVPLVKISDIKEKAKMSSYQKRIIMNALSAKSITITLTAGIGKNKTKN